MQFRIILIEETQGGNGIYHSEGSNHYKILDESNTSANPTLSGGETNLTSLKLNSTTYAIPSGGGHLYQHNISFYSNANGIFTTSVIDSSATPFTYKSFKTWLIDNGFTSEFNAEGEKIYHATGAFSNGSVIKVAVGFYVSQNYTNTISATIIASNSSSFDYFAVQSGSYTFTDTVTQIS